MRSVPSILVDISDILSRNDDVPSQSNDVELDYYDELISHIQDNQNIIKQV